MGVAALQLFSEQVPARECFKETSECYKGTGEWYKGAPNVKKKQWSDTKGASGVLSKERWSDTKEHFRGVTKKRESVATEHKGVTKEQGRSFSKERLNVAKERRSVTKERMCISKQWLPVKKKHCCWIFSIFKAKQCNRFYCWFPYGCCTIYPFAAKKPPFVSSFYTPNFGRWIHDFG